MPTPTGAPDAIVHPQGPFGFRVDPPVVSKRRDDTFTILNATNATVRVSFPVLATTPPSASVTSFNRESFVINQSNANGVYDYHVEVAGVTLAGVTLRATANSDPQIIID